MTGSKKNRLVLVTGFGPFGNYKINASWEAVKELKNTDIEKKLNITLIIKEVPVIYETVSNVVPKLWSEHNPMLVIHVGVSGMAKCLELESQAHHTGYVTLDMENKIPLNILSNEVNENINGAELVTKTAIDVEGICEAINESYNSVGNDDRGELCEANVSQNAGRYLCGYIFSKSLEIDRKRTMFIHVPELQVYNAKKTAKGLYDVISCAIEKIQ